MIVYPNCKINLGLQVLRKRNDGFHDLDSVFYPIQWRDILEGNLSDSFSINYSGLEIPGTNLENSISKTFQLLKKDFPHLEMKFHLHKILPMGAGLGGGSSDAAFCLKLINETAALGLNNQQLKNYAAQIGSDCTFFIENQVAWTNNRGDELEPITFSLENYKILLVHPNLHISTKDAFSKIIPSENRKTTKEIVLHTPIENWKNELKNDFEIFAFEHFPQLISIKNDLYSKGAVYASMSGSGSCMYGIFKNVNEETLSYFEKQKYYCKLL